MRHVLLLAERPVPSVTIVVAVVLLAAALGVLAARPTGRRRHARLAGGTVDDLQKIVGDPRSGDVLPAGRGRRAAGRAAVPVQFAPGGPAPARRLVDLVGAEHPVSGTGRHRRPLALLAGRSVRRLPLAYWEAYLAGVDVPVRSGAGERFFAPGDAAGATPGEQLSADPATEQSDHERPVEEPMPSRPSAPVDEGTDPQPATDDVQAGTIRSASRWFDDAPDGRARSRRSAVLARVARSTDLGGWWNSTPQVKGTAPAFPDEDEQPAPSAFWGPGASVPPRPAGRQVAVVDLAASPSPLPQRRPPAGSEVGQQPVAPRPIAGPVAVEPEPVAVEPEPVAVEPEPVVEPEPEPDPVDPVDPVADPPSVPQQRSPRQPSPQQRLVLRRASRRFDDATDRFEIAQIACEESLDLVEADVASLVVKSVEGPRVLRQDPAGHGIWGAKTLQALVNLGRPLRKVIEGDPLCDGGRTALLVVPVPAAGSVAATLVVRRTTGRAFSPAEQDVLDRLARITGSALGAAARRGVVIGTRPDPVTGLAPRERLVEELRAALLTSQTHGMVTSLVVVGVTGLAALRDAAGRPAADEAVHRIASAVTATLRVGDVAYRFGDDELAVLLPATQTSAAPAVAQRIADDVAALGVTTHGIPLAVRTAVVPVVGVAEDVVAQAVRALAAGRPTVDA